MADPRKDYDYTPSFTKGGQGRLFHTRGAAHTEEQRWPRGYTPERRAEVFEAVTNRNEDPWGDSRTNVSYDFFETAGVNYDAVNRNLRSKREVAAAIEEPGVEPLTSREALQAHVHEVRGLGSLVEASEASEKANEAAVGRVGHMFTEAIAPTSIPVEHIESLRGPLSIHGEKAGLAGWYQPYDDSISVVPAAPPKGLTNNRRKAAIRSNKGKFSKTTTHEMGHHVSYAEMEESRARDLPLTSGGRGLRTTPYRSNNPNVAEEGRAEGYTSVHHPDFRESAYTYADNNPVWLGGSEAIEKNTAYLIAEAGLGAMAFADDIQAEYRRGFSDMRALQGQPNFDRADLAPRTARREANTEAAQRKQAELRAAGMRNPSNDAVWNTAIKKGWPMRDPALQESMNELVKARDASPEAFNELAPAGAQTMLPLEGEEGGDRYVGYEAKTLGGVEIPFSNLRYTGLTNEASFEKHKARFEEQRRRGIV